MYTVDLYLRVRLACHVDGLSQREAASRFGIARETVRKMLRHSEPPGYRRRQPPKRPKLAPFTDIIDRILEEDRTVHRKQHHTAKRIFERLIRLVPSGGVELMWPLNWPQWWKKQMIRLLRDDPCKKVAEGG